MKYVKLVTLGLAALFVSSLSQAGYIERDYNTSEDIYVSGSGVFGMVEASGSAWAAISTPSSYDSISTGYGPTVFTSGGSGYYYIHVGGVDGSYNNAVALLIW